VQLGLFFRSCIHPISKKHSAFTRLRQTPLHKQFHQKKKTTASHRHRRAGIFSFTVSLVPLSRSYITGLLQIMMSGLGDLPTPGTPPFFPALLASIRAAAPGLPLDPVVLQALLLCLLAGDKNLILRTREEDVSSVSKLAASVSKSL
jgi:hypothetical protein